MTPTEVADRYIEAYRAANGKTPPSVDYRKGWFVLKHLLGEEEFAISHYRRSEIIEMTETLLRRTSMQNEK